MLAGRLCIGKLPVHASTYHLLSARRLALMQPSAYIVNTARGGIIDEDALIKLVTDGNAAGAGLDVFEHDPMTNRKLLKLADQGRTCCCRTWPPPRSRVVSSKAKKSSSTSRPMLMGHGRRIVSCRAIEDFS